MATKIYRVTKNTTKEAKKVAALIEVAMRMGGVTIHSKSGKSSLHFTKDDRRCWRANGDTFDLMGFPIVELTECNVSKHTLAINKIGYIEYNL